MCYYCDAKYSLNHKCASKPQIFILDSDNSNEWISDVDPNAAEHPALNDIAASIEISLHTLSGTPSSSQLRFSGSLAGYSVQVLVDSGNSLNFIQSRLALHLPLPIESIPRFSVAVGNGQKLYAEGCIRNVYLFVQDFEIHTDFFVFPIEGTDVVLGISFIHSWLCCTRL